MAIDQVIKRDGRRVPFDRKRIENAIYAAARAVESGEGRQWAETLSWAVTGILEERFGQAGRMPHVEEIQDIVEEVLIKSGHPQVAKAYILYRQKRAEARAAEQMFLDTVKLVDDYLDQTDWRVSENSNMNYSLQGLNFYLASSIAARYWLHKIYPPEVQRAHIEGDFHIHDLGMLSSYTYYGKEVVILKDKRGLHLTSFEQAYAGCPEPEVCLNEADGAFAKYPRDCFVLDKDGWTRVIRLVRKRKDRPMHFIENRGGRSVIVTDNHPMLTSDGERLAADVRPRADALYTVDLGRLLTEENLFSETEIDLLSELQGASIPSIGRDRIYFNGVPITEIDLDRAGEGVIHTVRATRRVSPHPQTVPRRLRLTADLGYFVGFVLAEGYLYDTKASRTISITRKTPDVLHAINRTLIALGTPGCIVRRNDGIFELRVRNVFLRFLFEHVFRIQPGARHKSLPVRTLHYNVEFVKGMLAGVMDGAGSMAGNDTPRAIRASTRTLLEQMACVLHLLGETPYDRNIEGVGPHRVESGRDPLYGLPFRKTAELTQSTAVSASAWHDETGDAWHAVLNNEPTEIPDDEIYDITTESGTLIVNGMWNHNCTGWDLQDLLIRGFGGVPAKIESRPPRHLRTALGQLVNFFYTLQGEVAGAVAVSNFDTLLAPFIRYDRLDEVGVKQALQEFIFNINVPTRVGFQTPFTNITMDLTPPPTLRDQPVIIGGKPQEATYGEFQREMDLLNRTFAEVMLEGDARSRVFTFPIPTYNITREFPWENPSLETMWSMTVRYGIPYFGNFISSDMRPEDTRSMCCRLRLDNRELRRRLGGLFAAAPLTGSVGVVTINMPRLAYLAEDEKDFFRRLERLMEIARTSLEIKRKMLEHLTERGLYPYSRHYLEAVRSQTGDYWSNHFSTIGLIGMNEACLNLLGVDIAHPDGKALAVRTLNFMRQALSRFQEETGNLYNLEATPAEGASYRLARADRKRYPNIRTAGTPETPYYTNSTHLPVSYTDDLFEVLEHQDELQTLYTGGTVLHIFLGERLHDGSQVRRLVRLITENYRLPYFTITPTFSICPVHGYIPGEHFFCPYEHTAEELARYGVNIELET